MTDASSAAASQTQGPLINSLAIIFTTFSTASVVLRVYTRKRILKVTGLDDQLICVAQILSIGVMIGTILGKWIAAWHRQELIPTQKRIGAWDDIRQRYRPLMAYCN